MFKVPIAELKEKIQQGSNLSAEDLDEKIKAKINELSGLISEEGAAHIIANEMGIKIVEEEGRFKINKIYAGMKQVEVLGKVTQKFPIREFDKNGRQGKIGAFVIGDDSGTIRIACWNDQADIMNELKEEDVVLISSGYAKENNFNQVELHLNDRSSVSINPEGETIGTVKQKSTLRERKKIDILKEGDLGVELMGTVVQVFDPRYFNVCPECSKRVDEREDGFYCNEHSKVEAASSYVLNLVLDDGTGTIRGVFWKNQTNNLLGKSDEEMVKFKENMGLFEDLKTELLGEQFKVIGRVNRNEMFDRLEFVAQIVEKANPTTELNKVN